MAFNPQNFFIYVLQLSNNMYYIHPDCAEHFELQNVCFAAAIKSPLVRKYMPDLTLYTNRGLDKAQGTKGPQSLRACFAQCLRSADVECKSIPFYSEAECKWSNKNPLIEKVIASNSFEIDAKVKQYMMKYGYENVRGGSYSEETLSDEQISVIQREMIYASSMYYLTPDTHTFIREYLKTYLNMNEDERAEHIQSLERDYASFLKEKGEYENLQNIMEEICVGEPLIKKLDFIKSQCEIIYKTYSCPMPPRPSHFIGHRESKTIIEIYVILCRKFKLLSKIFSIVFPDSYEKLDKVLTKHPEFLLDDFIYHKHYVANRLRYNAVETLLKQYVFMCNKLINRLEEYKHSVYSWDPQLEKKIILSNLLHSCNR